MLSFRPIITPDKKYAYEMGVDCATSGANTTNCNFSIFTSKENTAEWERGKRDGKEHKNGMA